MTTRYSDITTLVDPSQQYSTLSLQVKLSQLLSTILTSKWILFLYIMACLTFLIQQSSRTKEHSWEHFWSKHDPFYIQWPVMLRRLRELFISSSKTRWTLCLEGRAILL